MRHKTPRYLFVVSVVVFGMVFLFLLINGNLGREFAGLQRLVNRLYYASSLYFPNFSFFEPVFKIAVPFHRQEHALSCEIASLAMALEFYKVPVSESDLISKLAVSTTSPRMLGGNVWGDPEQGFVGNIDGVMPNTGYGVYEQPVGAVARQYRTAKAVKNASLKDVLDEVSNNRPVIVWGYVASGRDISWSTPQGEEVKAVYGEHARVITGFSGTSSEPKEIFLMDPVYGQIHFTAKQFLKNWAALDNRAVIVY